MKNEPILKLAISLQSNPGVYALLLGSGISKAANIPTGWDVVLDLIRKLSALETKEPQSDLETWYRETFGEQPDYSKILDRLTATPAERMALLRGYFEPSDEDREKGFKLPTVAHRAIATLVKLGYIRVILTTNFDRLTELAVEAEGIVPDVISSDDTLNGAMPITHSKGTIIKLHGDYRDTRIKNTPEELAQYSPEMNAQLDRILDDHGLIVAGWSGTYDTALRNAILRTPTRRFSTFWVTRGDVTEEAKLLIEQRRAEVITAASADKFFGEFLEKLESLRDLDQGHPLSVPVAVATTKRYLADSHHRIQLYDLVREETERVCNEMRSERFATNIGQLTQEQFVARLNAYEKLAERLMAIMAAIAFHDMGENASLLTHCIDRMMQAAKNDGNSLLVNLQRYPPLLALYSAGMAALAGRRYKNLAAVMRKPQYYNINRAQKRPAIEELHVWNVFDEVYKWIPRPREREFTPANNRLFEILKTALHDYLPDEMEYEQTFDIFEYLLGLTYMDMVKESWSPVGRFKWRYGSLHGGHDTERWARSPISEFLRLGTEQGESWELLKEGFFNGTSERFSEIGKAYTEFLADLRF